MPKVLIVFTDNYLAYSPTTLNIYHTLKNKGFEVEIIATETNNYFYKSNFENENVRYIKWRSEKGRGLYGQVISKIRHRLMPNTSLTSPKAKAFINQIKKSKADIYIAIDFMALWCLQFNGKKAFVVSLEIYEKDEYLEKVNFNQIKGVIIQSVERYDYLFENKVKPPCYLVQNAPPFIDVAIESRKRSKTDLLYCGTCHLDFGIITCLEFLKDFPEYTLTIIGAMPPNTQRTISLFFQDLVDNERLKIDTNYYKVEEFTEIVAGFRIGLVFYDVYHYLSLQKFNTYSIPSGKLYQYFNSGLPVVGNYLSGFSIVENQKAGVLITHLSTLQIKKAIDTIENDYETFALNSKKISKLMDSKVAIEHFIEKALNE